MASRVVQGTNIFLKDPSPVYSDVEVQQYVLFGLISSSCESHAMAVSIRM